MHKRSSVASLLIVTLPILSGCGGLVEQSKQWQHQSEEWQRKFQDLTKEVDEFRKTLPEVADKVDPIAVKEMYRDNKTLTEANQNLREALKTITTKEMYGAFRVTVKTNSLNERVSFSVNLYKMKPSADGCLLAIERDEPTLIRELIAVQTRTASTADALIHGHELGPGCYMIRREFISNGGYADGPQNILDIRITVDWRGSDANAPWSPIATEIIQGQDDEVSKAGKLKAKDTMIGVKVQ